jgi:hypothetical protein
MIHPITDSEWHLLNKFFNVHNNSDDREIQAAISELREIHKLTDKERVALKEMSMGVFQRYGHLDDRPISLNVQAIMEAREKELTLMSQKYGVCVKTLITTNPMLQNNVLKAFVITSKGIKWQNIIDYQESLRDA